jgi:hypothetical protein
MHRLGTRLAGFTLSCLVALLLSAPGADARERMGRSRMGAAKSGQAHSTVTRTGADGTARTSTHDTTWQRGGGKYTRDTLHTGPGGKQSTTHVEGQRTDGGYTKTTTHTGPKGTTTTLSEGNWDPETKTWTREKVVTRPDGSSSKTEVTTVVEPGAPEAAPAE